MGKQDHKWRFFRAGGVDQVVLERGEDLARLKDLDQKLWVALACPTKGLEVDEQTLKAIDSDGDGRVRVPEVLGALEWCGKIFKSLDLLFEPGTTIALSDFDASTPEGKAVRASARRILQDRGKKDAKEIALEDVQAMTEAFVATRFNGDGVVPADSADDEAVRKAIDDMIVAVGSLPDRSGKPGVDQQLVDSFFEQADALLAWDAKGSDALLEPLGEKTAAAADALGAVEAKIRDYFTRCRIAAFDAKAAAALNTTDAELQGLSSRSLTSDDVDLAKLPIARVEAGRPLPLAAGVNPAWAAKLAAFAEATVEPIHGKRAELGEAHFEEIVGKLAPHRAWRAEKPTGPVADLGVARVRELRDLDARGKIAALVAEDVALQAEYTEIASVEKAIRLRRDLLLVLRNFVNFADFYGRKGATFRAGTLFLDGRACELTIYVNDAAAHAKLAGLSRAYLAYCDCRRGDEKTNIVAAFTAGDVDHLMAGRNGVFYDRKGRDWDATITSIVDNPLSIRQAFWSPYKRLVRMVEEQVAKRAAEKEKASTAQIDQAAAKAATADQAAAAPPAVPGAAPPAPGAPGAAGPTKKFDVGMVAAIGVAVAGLATFLSSVLATFLGLGLWMPVGLLALLLAVSGPSMLIAWLKLRQRNLGPILDANGWAVNARVKINVPFGGSLTSVAALPKGSTRAATDPYAEKRRPWWLYLLILVVLALGVVWLLGHFDRFLPDSVKASRVVYGAAATASASAPAAAPAAPPAPAAPAAPAPAPAAK